MRNITYTILAGLLIGIMSCAGSKRINYKSPESVAMHFIRSLAVLDIEQVNRVATEDTKSVMTLLESMKEMVPEDELEEMTAKSSEQVKTLKKANCTMQNDETASCTFCCSDEGKLSENPITLKKVDNKWLVHMSKEEMMGSKK